MIPIRNVTETLQIQTCCQTSIKLQFLRHDDRWSHRIRVASEGWEAGVMDSLEGTPAEIWPASPPIQEVNLHSLPGCDAILGVGMAGQSHWSASFSSETQGWLKADLACLQNSMSTDATLGSAYQIDAACQIKSVTLDRVELVTGSQSEIRIESVHGNGFQTSLEISDRVLSIKPKALSSSQRIATRWGFRIKAGSAPSTPRPE